MLTWALMIAVLTLHLVGGAAPPRVAYDPTPEPVTIPVPEVRAEIDPWRLTPMARFEAKVTAYNSLENQTDSSPWITATNTRAREGIVAVSRDFLKGTGLAHVPYGSLLRLDEVRTRPGCNASAVTDVVHPGQLFLVEDTMHARKHHQVDIWMRSHQDALTWGSCRAVFSLVRQGSPR